MTELNVATEDTYTPAAFRFRVVLFLALYFLGFYAPWARYAGKARALSTTWIALSALLARTNLVTLANATVIVTLCAVIFAAAGALLRVWATAYLGAGVMRDQSLRAEQVVASGPYRYLRNPLYLGNLFTCAAVSILMPVSGAVVFLAGCALLTFALVAAEGPHLSRRLGAAYDVYRAEVPSFVPAARPNLARSVARPRWAQSVAAEIFHVGYALCLVVFAWQYNVDVLIRALLICFGLSLVTRGMFVPRPMRPASLPPTHSL